MISDGNKSVMEGIVDCITLSVVGDVVDVVALVTHFSAYNAGPIWFMGSHVGATGVSQKGHGHGQAQG